MPERAPWHSTQERVCHNNSSCTAGNQVEKENLRAGTGGKPLCQECAKLNKEGK